MDVKKVAQLANLKLSEKQEDLFAQTFVGVMGLIDKIQDLDVSKIDPTASVTNLENVTRDDVIDTSRGLSQEEALMNAKESHCGYFKIGSVFK